MRERALEREMREFKFRTPSLKSEKKLKSLIFTAYFCFSFSFFSRQASILNSIIISRRKRAIPSFFFHAAYLFCEKSKRRRPFSCADCSWITFTTLFTERISTSVHGVMGWLWRWESAFFAFKVSCCAVSLFFFENEADDFCDFWGLSCAAWNHH